VSVFAQQYDTGQRLCHCEAGNVTAGLAENNVSLVLGLLHNITCRLSVSETRDQHRSICSSGLSVYRHLR